MVGWFMIGADEKVAAGDGAGGPYRRWTDYKKRLIFGCFDNGNGIKASGSKS
jgi:hypothetical protein